MKVVLNFDSVLDLLLESPSTFHHNNYGMLGVYCNLVHWCVGKKWLLRHMLLTVTQLLVVCNLLL